MRRQAYVRNIRRDRAMAQSLTTNENELLQRMNFASQMGVSFGGKRDIYTSSGYKRTLGYQAYRDEYDRGDIASTIIKLYPTHTWKVHPEVRENADPDDESTDFEKDWQQLLKKIPLFSYLLRADILSGIGTYGGLFLGVNDGKDFNKPLDYSVDNELMYVRPLARGSLDISEYDGDKNSERFGYPVMYNATFGGNAGSTQIEDITASVSEPVHWSRIIHLADNRDENEVIGIPRLQQVYNRLFDLTKIMAASGEMFWLGAFQGISFEGDAEAGIQDESALENKLQQFSHGYQRYLVTQGLKANRLAPSLVSPKNHVEVQIQMICATLRCPTRLLLGSERGELSSSQDGDNWDENVMGRRENYATPFILRPLVDRLIEHGILSSPEEGPMEYDVIWPDISEPTKRDKMETLKIAMGAVKDYMTSGAKEDLIPPDIFLREYMEMDSDTLEEVKKIFEGLLREEEAEMSEAVKTIQEDMDLQEGDEDPVTNIKLNKRCQHSHK